MNKRDTKGEFKRNVKQSVMILKGGEKDISLWPLDLRDYCVR